MKKIISRALMTGVLLIGVMAQANAAHLSPVVNEANHLRATSNSLNAQAAQIENTIRYKQAYGMNPVHLKYKAMKLRKQAQWLAIKSNQVAKAAFDHGYHRNNHSHGYGYHHHGHHGHHH